MKKKLLAVIISAAMAFSPAAGSNVIASESSILSEESADTLASDESKVQNAEDQDTETDVQADDGTPSETLSSGEEEGTGSETQEETTVTTSDIVSDGESTPIESDVVGDASQTSESESENVEAVSDETSSESASEASQTASDEVTKTEASETNEETVIPDDTSQAVSEKETESETVSKNENTSEPEAVPVEEVESAISEEAAASTETSVESEADQTLIDEEVAAATETSVESEAVTKEADQSVVEEEVKLTAQAIALPNRYLIRSVAKSSLAIEIKDGQTSEGANVQLGTNKKYNRQSYIFESTDEDNIFKIKNTGTGLYLSASGTNLVQSSKGSEFYVSKITKKGKKFFSFKEVESGYVISVDGSAKDGADLVLSNNENDNTQLWYLTKNAEKTGLESSGEDALLDNGYYRISLTNENHRMAVKNAGISDGDNVLIDTNYASDGEYWYIKSLGDGLYTIKAFCSDMVLTVGYDTVESLMNVYQSKYTGATSQKWYIRKSSVLDGAYVICSASDPDYVIGSYGSDIKNGSNVRMYFSSSAANRRWNITSVTSPKEYALSNGTYYFTSRLSYNRVLSVKSDSTKSNANVVLSLKKDTKGERWIIKSLGYGNLYKVTNYSSGCSLASSSSSSSANVLQKTYSDVETMTWRIMPAKSGSTVYYRIINVSNDRAVIVKGNNKKSGTNILLGKQSSSKGQQWAVEKAANSPAKYTNICLTVSKNKKLMVSMITGSNADNKKIIIDDGKKNELTKTFYISAVSKGVYKIECVGSDKYLSVYKSKTSNNAAVVQAAWNNLDSQKWTIEKYSSGYRFKNIGSGKYLTIKNSNFSEGTNLVIYKAKSDKSQIFNWKTASPVTNGWTTINDHRAYVKDGVIQIKKFIDSGKYYVDGNGYIYTGWKKYGRYYYYYNGSNGYVNDTRPYLNKLFGTKKSKYGDYKCPKCEYYITVDTGYPCMATVYTKYPNTDYFNLPVFAFLVSPGKDSTPTDAGSRMTGGNQRWKALMGPSWGQYSTEALIYTIINGSKDWYCNGEYFHSVACSYENTHNLNPGTYNLLGTQQSHGCIRCPVRYSYWVYEYVEYGSNMYVGSGLSRPIAHVPIPAATGNIDPTDPNYTGNWGYTDTNNYVSGYWSGYIAR